MDSVNELANRIRRTKPAHLPPAGYYGGVEMACSPKCECKGLGWFRMELPITHPEFGKLIPCPNRPLDRAVSSRYGLDEAEMGLTWDSVIPGVSRGDQAVDKVRAVLSRGFGLVYLYGDHGQAKTLLLKAAVAQSVGAGVMARYATMGEILDDIRLAYDADNQNHEVSRRIKRWTSSLHLLAIDELERESETPWVNQRKFDLIDARHVQAIRGQSVTLIASNTAPEKLASALYDRIMDRRHERVELRGASGRRIVPMEMKL